MAKTFVMMIGEFEFEGIFFGTDYMDSLQGMPQGAKDDFMNSVFLPRLTYLFFILFVVLMPILMMNMLVSVGDNRYVMIVM